MTQLLGSCEEQDYWVIRPFQPILIILETLLGQVGCFTVVLVVGFQIESAVPFSVLLSSERFIKWEGYLSRVGP